MARGSRRERQAKHDAIVYALVQVLARQGVNVCGTEFGKSLGKGLYEFRLRHTRDELQAKVQPHLSAPSAGSDPEDPDTSAKSPDRVLLRIFFAVYGDKIVLLLGGYDKGKQPSARRQNTEITEARKRLRAHQTKLAADAKAARSRPPTPGHPSRTSDDTTMSAERRVPPARSFLMWFRKRRQGKAGRPGSRGR